MKYIILAILGIQSLAYAGTIQLQNGESITIQANTQTTVQCSASGNGGSEPGQGCADAANGFRSTLEYCAKSYSGGYCANSFWPEFKKDNPGCIYAGKTACLEACSKTYSGGYCTTSLCK